LFEKKCTFFPLESSFFSFSTTNVEELSISKIKGGGKEAKKEGGKVYERKKAKRQDLKRTEEEKKT
jgi:hypothetical protein